MMGSRALGVHFRKYRGHRPIQVVADALGKSTRWLAYVEAGRTAPDWIDLREIARILGPVDGPIFLKEAALLLFEEADMTRVKAEVMAAVRRREFLGVLGLGAGAVDMEHLARTLQGLGVDTEIIASMARMNRLYAEQTRAEPPGVLISALQLHLRNYLDLVVGAPEKFSQDLKAGAAEAALLTGVTSFRLGHPVEATHYWSLAKGLAAECGHLVVEAYTAMIRPALTLHPAEWGGGKGADPKETVKALDLGLAMLGSKPTGIAAVTFHAWRSGPHSALGNALAAKRDLESAVNGLNKLTESRSEDDVTGLGVLNPEILAAEQATSALLLQQPNEVVQILESGIIEQHTSAGWRSARMADLAGAYAQRGDHEQAVNVLLDAADIALSGKDPWRLRRLQGIRRTWLPANLGGDAIKELDRKLTASLSTSGP
jgi:hypothetical protein